MELPQSSIKQENDHSSPAMELNKNYKIEHLGLTKNSIASLMKIKTELHPVDIKIEPCLDVLELKNEDHKLQLSVEDKIIEENNKCVVDCPVLFERENSQENSKVKIESEKISKIEKSDFENWTIDNDELNIKEEEHKSRDSGNSIYDEIHCEHCGHKTSRKFINSHLQTHKFQYKCQSCEFKTIYRNSLKRHLLQHTDLKESDTFNCNQCEYKTPYKYRLKIHHSTNHNAFDTIGLFKCTRCSFTSDYNHLLRRHNKLKHSKSEELIRYRCDLCDFQSVHKSSLNWHSRKHRKPEEEFFFKCSQCDYKSVYKKYLKSHILKHAQDRATFFRCNKCDYQSIHRSGIRAHLLKHKNPDEVEIFKCYQCDYRTPYKQYLPRHLIRHRDKKDLEDEDLFKCDVCDFKTKLKEYLKRHQLKKHERYLSE